MRFNSHIQLWKSFYNIIFLVVILSMSSCKEPEGPAGSKGYDGKGFEALTDPRIAPRVIYTYPSNNSQGPYDYNNQFQIRFNKIMDLESFKKGVILYSAVDTMALDTNSLATEGGDIIQFSVRDISASQTAYPWKIGKSYILKIPKEIMDMNGNHPLTPYIMTFMPEPYFRVTSISPKNMTTNLNLVPKLRITFNSPVDTSIISSVLITPPITLQWSFNSSMRTISSAKDTARFEVDTQYTVTILPSARDKSGNRLAAEFKSTFKTVPFRISSTSIKNGSIGVVSTLGQISFTLTAPIDTASIKNGISILPPIKYYYWGTNGRDRYKILFNQSEPFASSTKYTINLTSSIRSVSGKPLVPLTLEFTTAEPR